jgi:preprotein translocase subunit SecB
MSEAIFELKSVALLKSEFERPLDLTFSKPEVRPAISLKVEFNQVGEPVSKIEVELTVSVSVPTSDETQPMKASASMLGVFDLKGEASEEAISNFGNINGPAILYPFVREVIASLTMKGNVPPVLLPTMNFVAAYRFSQQTAKGVTEKKPLGQKELKKGKSVTTAAKKLN